jgi:NAD(P)-dependent dehydrogenase (short-subunit alcohol dehydrogenase family)
MFNLDGRIAVVTGAATGLGADAAIRLASGGAIVELLYRNRDAASVVEKIKSSGGSAYAQKCDVTDEAQIARCAAEIEKRHGLIDILVNNAGSLPPRTPWHQLTREDVDRTFQTNFVGYFLVAKAFYPLLKRSRHGRLINIASRTFYLGSPGLLAYVASKGAVMGMTRVLAKELGDDGITVNCLAPGMIATPATEALHSDERFEQTMQIQAIKKRVQPRHVSSMIAFLASDEAEMITGQCILCDGGGYMMV